MKRDMRKEAASALLICMIGFSAMQVYAADDSVKVERDGAALELERVDENYEYEAFAEAEDLSDEQQDPAAEADMLKEEIGSALPGTWTSGRTKFTFDGSGSFACETGGEITQGNYILAPDYAVRDYSDGSVFMYIMDGSGGLLCPMYVGKVTYSDSILTMDVILKDGSARSEGFGKSEMQEESRDEKQ